MRVDKSVINTLNKQNIINIIRENTSIFKAEISRMADLSIPTVMRITDELVDRGLVRAVGKSTEGMGKPAQLLEFVPDMYYIVGVDIGTTNIQVVIMDLSADIKNKVSVLTGIGDAPETVIARAIDAIDRAINEQNFDKDKLLGIGIGMPGILDPDTGRIIFSPDFHWEDVELVKPIRERFQMPVIIDNVSRAMAMGERWFGHGRNVDNFMCINLGYGIGSAIVIDGELYAGSFGASGEFGHMTMEKNGPLCECGNHGCLEALASASAITKKARSFVERGENTAILDLADGDFGSIEAKTIYDAARRGDALALEIVHESAEYIGVAIANVINFLDPSLIILEGGVSRAGAILTDNIEKTIARRSMKHAGNKTKIVTSNLGDSAASIGAAAFFVKRLIESGGDVTLMRSKV